MHGHDVGHLRHAQQRGDAGRGVFAQGIAAEQHVGVPALHQRDDLRGEHGAHQVGVGGVVHRQRLGGAVDLGGLFGHGLGVVREDDDVDVTADGLRDGHHLGHTAVEFAVCMIGNDQNFAH